MARHAEEFTDHVRAIYVDSLKTSPLILEYFKVY